MNARRAPVAVCIAVVGVEREGRVVVCDRICVMTGLVPRPAALIQGEGGRRVVRERGAEVFNRTFEVAELRLRPAAMGVKGGKARPLMLLGLDRQTAEADIEFELAGAGETDLGVILYLRGCGRCCECEPHQRQKDRTAHREPTVPSAGR